MSGALRVESFLGARKIGFCIVPKSKVSPTSLQIKTLIWESQEGGPFALVLDHRKRVDRDILVQSLLKLSALKVSERRSEGQEPPYIKLCDRDKATELSGYQIGCIPPIAHHFQMPIYVDRSLMLENDSDVLVYAGCGDFENELEIPLHDLLSIENVSVLDITKTKPVKSLQSSPRINPDASDLHNVATSRFRRAAIDDDTNVLNDMIKSIKSSHGVQDLMKIINSPSNESGKTSLHLAAWRGQ